MRNAMAIVLESLLPALQGVRDTVEQGEAERNVRFFVHVFIAYFLVQKFKILVIPIYGRLARVRIFWYRNMYDWFLPICIFIFSLCSDRKRVCILEVWIFFSDLFAIVLTNSKLW